MTKTKEAVQARYEEAKALVEGGMGVHAACQQCKIGASTYRKLDGGAVAPKKKSKYQAIMVPESIDERITLTPRQLAQFVKAWVE